MNNKDTNICCVGHITLDKVITPEHTAFMPGGTAYYFGRAMASLGADNFKLLTSLAPAQYESVEELRRRGIDVEVFPSRSTVFFENKYGADSNHRQQKVRAKADPFTVDMLRNVEADIFHLGTLLADDFSLDVIKYLSGKGKVSVDAQGYLREVRGEDVYHVDWHDKEEAMPYIDYLKANETEMEVLTGYSDPRLAAKRLSQMGVKEVILTFGSEGSLVYTGGKFYEIPVYEAPEVVDATGCGDTYMAGYLYKRAQGADVTDSGRFAAAMCTLKIAQSGPFCSTIDNVNSLIGLHS